MVGTVTRTIEVHKEGLLIRTAVEHELMQNFRMIVDF